MITIKRTNYDFARVNATEEEWDALEKIVAFIANDFGATEIEYDMDGHVDSRENRFLSFAEGFAQLDDRSEKFHRDDLDLLIIAGRAVDNINVPGVSHKIRSSVSNQMYKVSIIEIFNDDLTPRENLAL